MDSDIDHRKFEVLKQNVIPSKAYYIKYGKIKRNMNLEEFRGVCNKVFALD